MDREDVTLVLLYTFSARLECCELGFASHLLDFLLDLCTLFCVNVVQGVYIYDLFNGSLVDPCVSETCCVIFETLMIWFC